MNRPRSFLLATACAMAVVLLTSEAQAQRGGPGGPGGFGGFGGFGGTRGGSPLFTLAMDAEMWAELKISDAQLGQMTRLEHMIDQQRSSMFANLRNSQGNGGPGRGGPGGGPPGGGAPGGAPAAQPQDQAARDAEREAMRTAMRENSENLQKQTDAALQKILKPEQFKRLRQIELQKEGPLVVSRADVALALNLAPDQIDSIKMVIDQLNQGQSQVSSSRRELFSRNRTDNESEADRDARRAKEAEKRQKLDNDAKSLKDQAIAQVAKILSKTQKEHFNKMLGKAFDLTKLNNGRGVQSSFDANPFGFGRGGPPTTTTTTTTTTRTPTAAQTKAAVPQTKAAVPQTKAAANGTPLGR